MFGTIGQEMSRLSLYCPMARLAPEVDNSKMRVTHQLFGGYSSEGYAAFTNSVQRMWAEARAQVSGTTIVGRVYMYML